MSNLRVAILGECMVELQQNQSGLLSRRFGGDTLNTAVYIARLTQNSPITISYFTGLGVDAFSQEMLASWQHEGIDTQYVQQLDNKLPGLYLIETDAQGERNFRYWRNDAAAKYFLEQNNSEQLIALLSDFDWIYLSGITLAILTPQSRNNLFTALKQAKSKGAHIVFDNNYRPALWETQEQAQQVYQQVLILSDLALLTFDDELALYGEHSLEQCVQRTQQYGVETCFVKMGAEPCHIYTGSEHYIVAANKIPKELVVDTTAAGDSFGAGVISALLCGKAYPEAAKWGHCLAGTVIQYKGAIIDPQNMPNLD
ncbi:sugar kinase [Celerinatantimonas sp. YJH-8]|uniref:sugar kinase n=1 Tax=Celerinatantimonas sp. YJH-8 TaxID=3228714 RepID=UPI0038C45969